MLIKGFGIVKKTPRLGRTVVKFYRRSYIMILIMLDDRFTPFTLKYFSSNNSLVALTVYV